MPCVVVVPRAQAVGVALAMAVMARALPGHSNARAMIVLVLLLTAYKLSALPRGHSSRPDVSVAGLARLGSLTAVLLLVPLLLTGIVLLLAPPGNIPGIRGTSFVMYLHLIAAAWWTALMLWHLKRYLLPALHAVAGDRQLERHRPASVYRRVPTLEPRRTPANARQDR